MSTIPAIERAQRVNRWLEEGAPGAPTDSAAAWAVQLVRGRRAIARYARFCVIALRDGRRWKYAIGVRVREEDDPPGLATVWTGTAGANGAARAHWSNDGPPELREAAAS